MNPATHRATIIEELVIADRASAALTSLPWRYDLLIDVRSMTVTERYGV